MKYQKNILNITILFLIIILFTNCEKHVCMIHDEDIELQIINSRTRQSISDQMNIIQIPSPVLDAQIGDTLFFNLYTTNASAKIINSDLSMYWFDHETTISQIPFTTQYVIPQIEIDTYPITIEGKFTYETCHYSITNIVNSGSIILNISIND